MLIFMVTRQKKVSDFQSCLTFFFTQPCIFVIYLCFVLGIFMYGNHFDNIVDNIECMIYPKLMSINNQNFHYTSCNFSEHNMYSK